MRENDYTANVEVKFLVEVQKEMMFVKKAVFVLKEHMFTIIHVFHLSHAHVASGERNFNLVLRFLRTAILGKYITIRGLIVAGIHVLHFILVKI